MEDRRVTKPPDRVPVVGAQAPRKGLAPKAHLHGVEGHTPLALQKYQCLFPSLNEVDIGSLGSATSLPAEAPAEAPTAVGMENTNDFWPEM